jgi:hypothetical protein
MGIYQFYSGVVQTSVHGMSGRVPMQLQMGISQFYSGVEQMDVRGMNGLVQRQL